MNFHLGGGVAESVRGCGRRRAAAEAARGRSKLGLLIFLRVESFARRHGTKPGNPSNREHATRRQISGTGFERDEKRRSFKHTLACVAGSHIQTRGSVVRGSHGFGKYCSRSAGGRALFGILRCGQAAWEDSSRTRGV